MWPNPTTDRENDVKLTYVTTVAAGVTLAAALADYVSHPELIREHGRAGRRRAEESFGIEAMVASYTEVYDGVMAQCGHQVSERSTTPCAG